MSLKEKTIFGILWTFTNAFLVKGLFFVAMLVLARWLGPVDFGLVGMITVFIALGTTLVDSGLSASLIRTPNVDKRDFSTIFFMNVLMGLLAYGVLYVAAPYIAVFYNQEVLIQLIRIYGLIFIVSACSSVQLALLQKEMRFKKITLLNIPCTIIGAALGLFLGFQGFGVWSIVAMYLATQGILSILLWVTSVWKPGLFFSRELLARHYQFGYKLMLSGLLNTIFNNSYHVVIGKFFPVRILGFFERAQRFNEYPVMTFTSVIERVTYPMMAQLQGDRHKLSETYKKMIKVAFFITAPLMLGAAALARPLLLWVLGEQWLPAVPYFQILCLGYMLYPIHAFNLNVLKVYGRSNWFLKLEVLKKVVLVLGIVIGLQFGILGLLWSSVASSFIALFINMYYSSQLIEYPGWVQLKDMLPILGFALLTSFLMFICLEQLNGFNLPLQILITTCVGVAFYLFIYSFFRQGPLYVILEILKSTKL